MGEALNMYPNSNDLQQFKLNKIIEVKNYFIAEIGERELMSIILSKDIGYFEYFDKSFIVLSATSGTISIASFRSICGNSKCKFLSCIFNVYKNYKEIVKHNTKWKEKE